MSECLHRNMVLEVNIGRCQDCGQQFYYHQSQGGVSILPIHIGHEPRMILELLEACKTVMEDLERDDPQATECYCPSERPTVTCGWCMMRNAIAKTEVARGRVVKKESTENETTA